MVFFKQLAMKLEDDSEHCFLPFSQFKPYSQGKQIHRYSFIHWLTSMHSSKLLP